MLVRVDCDDNHRQRDSLFEPPTRCRFCEVCERCSRPIQEVCCSCEARRERLSSSLVIRPNSPSLRPCGSITRNCLGHLRACPIGCAWPAMAVLLRTLSDHTDWAARGSYPQAQALKGALTRSSVRHCQGASRQVAGGCRRPGHCDMCTRVIVPCVK
ncbi:unnamed protein product [Trichogramma brassicae]|uniref:Uncharacterized protein n=1 Tax=Trichogramma brassicae TaxID=86971 RepID=A0A6H5HTU0_9HYME|nr:unnamed protein product [Trichogramma brassicae]